MKYWISVASKEHVLRGVDEGFAQVCHGKKAPLQRMKLGDWLIYYSPTYSFKGKDLCQEFTAIGQIVDGNVYQFDMGGGFCPFRIDVDYLPYQQLSIRPLINNLSFIRNKNRWGYMFRFGHFEIPESDFLVIKEAIGF